MKRYNDHAISGANEHPEGRWVYYVEAQARIIELRSQVEQLQTYNSAQAELILKLQKENTERTRLLDLALTAIRCDVDPPSSWISETQTESLALNLPDECAPMRAT